MCAACPRAEKPCLQKLQRAAATRAGRWPAWESHSLLQLKAIPGWRLSSAQCERSRLAVGQARQKSHDVPIYRASQALGTKAQVVL